MDGFLVVLAGAGTCHFTYSPASVLVTKSARCFLVQFPLALFGLGLVLWKLPEPRQFQPQQLEDDGKKVSNLSRIDFAGAITLVGTILTGLMSLEMATKGASVLITSSLAAAFMTFLVLFVLTEKHYADEPILPLDLVSKRDVLTSYLIVGFQSAGQFGVSNNRL